MPLLKDQQIPVPVVAAKQASRVGGPLVQAAVHVHQHGGFDSVAHALEDLLIIVHQEDGGNGPGTVKFIPDGGKFGDVHPVSSGQEAAPPLLLGADQVAKDLVTPVADIDLGGALVFALHEPPGVKVGHRLGDLSVKEMVPLPRDLEEKPVGPDDLLGLQAENDHGKRGVHHCVLGGNVNIPGDIFDVVEDLPPPQGVPLTKVEEEEQDQGPFRRGQDMVPHQRRDQREERQHHKVEPEARLRHTWRVLFVHGHRLL